MTYFLLHCHSTFIRLFLSGPCVYSMSLSHPYFCIQCLIIGITCTCTITVYINKYISYNIIELSVRQLPAVTITWHLVHRLHQRPDFNSYNPSWHVVIKLLLVDLWLRHANSCSTGAGHLDEPKLNLPPLTNPSFGHNVRGGLWLLVCHLLLRAVYGGLKSRDVKRQRTTLTSEPRDETWNKSQWD